MAAAGAAHGPSRGGGGGGGTSGNAGVAISCVGSPARRCRRRGVAQVGERVPPLPAVHPSSRA